jgi:hypothetical protein
MRRTLQDLRRAAQVHDFVARAISGPAMVEMQQLYSSVDGSEVQSGLANIISVAGFRQGRDDGKTADGGGLNEGGGDCAGVRADRG